MVRIVGGVVLAYVAMIVLMFSLFTGVYLALGADLSFQPQSFEVTPMWLGVMVGVLFVAGAAGGYICKGISGGGRGVIALVAVMAVLGALTVVMTMAQPKPAVTREGAVPVLAAMTNARQPSWFEFCKPVVGIVGVLVGAAFKRT